MLQPPVEGDLIKFYGVGAGGGADGGPPGSAGSITRTSAWPGIRSRRAGWRGWCGAAATALGLEVYGGDAIASADGGLVLLDVNAWPSFALYRDEAAPVIAAYLALRFAESRPAAETGGERAARARAALARDRGARGAPHRAGLPVLRPLLGPGHGPRQRQPLWDEDGNEYIDFIAGIAVGASATAIRTTSRRSSARRAAHLRQLHHRDPRALPRAAGDGHARGPHAHPALLGRRGGGGGRPAPGQGRDRAAGGLGFWGGFHGKTGGVLGCSAATSSTTWARSCPASTRRPTPTATAARSSSAIPDCGIACAEYVRDVIRYQTAGEIAAIIVEPIQGTAGNVIPPDGFLRAIQPVARDHGALLFADEMITGFGRTGSMWGAEHEGVVPDIMTVGKGVGGGFPLAGVVSTDKLTAAKPWSNPSFSSSSYGGNPLASAAGLAALEIILKEDLVKNADRVGAVMLGRARAPEGEVPHASARCAAAACCSASSWSRTGRPASRSARTITRPLPGVPAARARGDDLLADDPAQPAARSSPRTRRWRGSRSWTRRSGWCCQRSWARLGRGAARHRPRQRGGARPPARLAARGATCEIVAATDARPARRAECRAGSRRALARLGRVAAGREALDFVDICTPPSSHARPDRGRARPRPCTCSARSRWWAPPTSSRALAGLARARRRVLHTVHNWHHAPLVRAPPTLIREGRIGRVTRRDLADPPHPARGGRRRRARTGGSIRPSRAGACSPIMAGTSST